VGMNILCIGGGPAGLYFALLMRQRWPACHVTVVERNKAGDTFGWGVVLSDQTLQRLRSADAPTAQAIGDAFHHWDDILVHYRGQQVRTSGHGFCGIGRHKLLEILSARCQAVGVKLHYSQDVDDVQALAAQYSADLVIAADGINSRIRSRFAEHFAPDIDTRRCRFVWLGTAQTFDAFTFAFERTEHGWFAAHAYQFSADRSTFIVETPDEVWRAHGLHEMSQEDGIAFCEKLFAPYLGGHRLLSNASHLRGSAIWIQFPRVVCRTWVHPMPVGARQVPVVLMGDAAHTAHFSIGSGTKLALEDAIDLADALQSAPPAEGNSYDIDSALGRYQALRSVEVLKIQNAARNSTEWFENVERYSRLDAPQFTYSLLTRSQRISHDNLRLRDAAWLQGYEQWLAQAVVSSGKDGAAPAAQAAAKPTPPMLLPFTVRGLTLRNRVVVSPMAQYKAVEGVVGDWHLMHLGARALGGAALVMVEMTSPTAQGRITPACPGLWNEDQQIALGRIVQAVHEHSGAAIGLQLGHSGPKGSTQLGWQQMDEPLQDHPNWPLLAASAMAYGPRNATPSAMTVADMAQLQDAFVASTHRANAAGFDWLELHCAHGYLLSSFISPLTNQRTDAFGGSLANRAHYPLQVFAAMRAVWPAHKPMSVRISAHDWAPGGLTDTDAVQLAALFKAAGADVIDVSSGQTTRAARPVYGRMYQTPFADRIRNEVGVATMAVGAITDGDQVNSIIAAGRADLCAIGRPHLTNPAWTLHEAAKMGLGADWPLPYLSGRDQHLRLLERERAQAAATVGLSAAELAHRALEG
jgi:anthraniloyl-CoA monooxygenase